MNGTDIKSLNMKELEDFIKKIGEKPFRAKQIFQCLHEKHINDFDDMTSLSKDLRERLKKESYISNIVTADKYISKTDGTIKYLFELENKYIIESVLMRYDYGNSVCVSSQAGCRMGCKFCASAIGGLGRNLTAGEIVSQIYSIADDIGERISNVVVMGCGEPFDNFDNLINFIDIINSEQGANIGSRHITVSTCGLADKIYAFADMRLQVTLAVSLHAPNDEIRKTIMPVANKYSMDLLMKACKYYTDVTKRRITFEYALISDVNDSLKCAEELSELLKGMLCHVNIIPLNEVKERDFKKSEYDSLSAFSKILQDRGIETTKRRKLGSDIAAACGQLRNKYIEGEEI